MNKLYKYQLITALFACLYCFSVNLSAADKVIWKSGLNLYFKYVDQDTAELGKNDHPVDLEQDDITTALGSLIYLEKKLLSENEERMPVFTRSQTQLLGEQLSKGLRNAAPDQDIIFVIGGSSRKLLILTEHSFVAGRVFYKDGKLNIILGDYDRARNEAFEAVYDPSGKGNIPYTFNYGYRTRSNSGFGEKIVSTAGVNNKIIGNTTRQNWFEIDIKVAAAAAIAEKNRKERFGDGGGNEALQREAEKLARERREMRLEMARIRQEMNENQNSNNALSVEERLVKLNELKEKGLITEDEYNAKREEILGDI